MVDNKVAGEIIKIWEKGSNKLLPGHRTCAGCFIPTIVRTVLGTIEKDCIVSVATGCSEVTTTLWPHTSWNVPYIHNTFETSAVTLSGVESAYKIMKKSGKIKKDYKFVVFAGDGGTVDIGLQGLSGVLERGHNIMYVLYDNNAYANTGMQRSGATPLYASTTTSPSGKESLGKLENKKDIMRIVASHDIPYCAQANPYYLDDFVNKIKKAANVNGPSFLSVLMPCTLGWKFPTSDTVELCKLATESNYWPLYEIEDGRKWKLTYEPSNKVPVEEFLKTQGRFKHLFKPKPLTNEIKKIQTKVDSDFEYIKKMSLC